MAINENKYPKLTGYLTVTEVSKIIHETRQNTLAMLKRHKIPLFQIGKYLVIAEAEVPKLKDMEI